MTEQLKTKLTKLYSFHEVRQTSYLNTQNLHKVKKM